MNTEHHHTHIDSEEYELSLNWADDLSEWDIFEEYQYFLTIFDTKILLELLSIGDELDFWEDLDSNQHWAEAYQDVKDFVECLRSKLMACSTSASTLAKTNLLLIAAITGQSIDLTAVDTVGLDTYLSAVFDYSSTGLANRIGPEVPHTSDDTLQKTLKDKELAVTVNVDPPTVNVDVEAPDVTINNDIPVPSVTVNNDVPVPSVTVEGDTINFDTEAIATAIDNQADRIAPDGQSLYGATTVLADRVAPDGQSLYTTTQFLHTDLVSISGKLAPDGSNIFQALDDLKCICEQLKRIADIQNSEALDIYLPIILKTEQPDIIDAFKCDEAKFVIAVWSQYLAYLYDFSMLGLILVNLSMAVAGIAKYLTSLILKETADEVRKRAMQYAITATFNELVTPDDLYTFIDDWNDAVPDLICDLYSACDASEAFDNVMSRAESFTEGGSRNIARKFMYYLLSYGINEMFVEHTYTQEDIDEWVSSNLYTPSLNPGKPHSPAWADGWDSLDCEECEPCQPNFDCLDEMLWAYGTPSPSDGGSPAEWDLATYPIDTWITITSEWRGELIADARHQNISCNEFDSDYYMEFEILSVPSGLEVYFWIQDCDNKFITQQYHSEPANCGIFQARSMAFQTWPYGPTNPGTFQARIRRVS